MENVLLVTLSRAMSLQRKVDVLANNIANSQTNGFKRRFSEVKEAFIPPATEKTSPRGAARQLSFVMDYSTPLDTSMGQIEYTGNPLDIAVNSDAWLAVQTNSGERYTKNGALIISSQGQLVTSDGHAVIGEQGPFQFSNTEINLQISKDGTVSSSQGIKGKLKLVSFNDSQLLENIGANIFKTSEKPEVAQGVNVQSGFLERSNVKPAIALAEMMEASRNYQTIVSLMSKTEDFRHTAIQKLGETI